MNQDMMEALQAHAVERGISVDALFGALADALEHAYKRMPGAFEYAWVTINPETLEFQVFCRNSMRTVSRSATSSRSPPTTSAVLPLRLLARS